MLIESAKREDCEKCGHLIKWISEDIYGCDNCKKPIEMNVRNKKHHDYLRLDVFYLDSSKQTDHFEFCSWKCVFEKLPKIKTDYFINFPFISLEKDVIKGQRIEDFLNCIKR